MSDVRLPAGANAAVDRWRHGPSLATSLWRYKWLIAASAILLAVLAYGLSSLQAPTYQAEARLTLADPNQQRLLGQEGGGVDVATYGAQQRELLASNQVTERAAKPSTRDPGSWPRRWARVRR